MKIELIQFNDLPKRFQESFINKLKADLQNDHEKMGFGAPEEWRYNEVVNREVERSWFYEHLGKFFIVSLEELF